MRHVAAVSTCFDDGTDNDLFGEQRVGIFVGDMFPDGFLDDLGGCRAHAVRTLRWRMWRPRTRTRASMRHMRL